MTTYIPDQWLRNWFLGGPATVQYEQSEGELSHGSPEQFSNQLRAVWQGLAQAAKADARMVIRFGGINDRKANHVALLKMSLRDSGWHLITATRAGDASYGKRQARQFSRNESPPRAEYDFHAKLA